MMGILIKGGNLKTDMYAGKSPCEDEERDRGFLPPRNDKEASYKKAGGKAWKRFSLRKNQPC